MERLATTTVQKASRVCQVEQAVAVNRPDAKRRRPSPVSNSECRSTPLARPCSLTGLLRSERRGLL